MKGHNKIINFEDQKIGPGFCHEKIVKITAGSILIRPETYTFLMILISEVFGPISFKLQGNETISFICFVCVIQCVFLVNLCDKFIDN